jgi:glucose-6-phosphate 1-dehydrogenase
MRCHANAPKPVGSVQAYHLLRNAIVEANHICHSELFVDEVECAIAWDTVDEIARGIAAREARDPLEDYCAENPDADECRMYDI